MKYIFLKYSAFIVFFSFSCLSSNINKHNIPIFRNTCLAPKTTLQNIKVAEKFKINHFSSFSASTNNPVIPWALNTFGRVNLKELRLASAQMEKEGVQVTYLAVAAISDDHIRAAFISGLRLNTPVLFIIYRSQVDLKKFNHSDHDGYTTWNQIDLMKRVEIIAAEVNFNLPFEIIRDHGGITFDPEMIEEVKNAREEKRKINPNILNEANERARESFTADKMAGITSFHIDNSLLYNPQIKSITERIEPVLSLTVEHIQYLENLHDYREDYGLEIQVNEIGTKRNTDPEEFKYFMKELASRLKAKGIFRMPDFIAANIGTTHGIGQEEPNIDLMNQLDHIARTYNARFSSHGTSGVSNEYLIQFPKYVGKANVDSALTMKRIKAIKELAPEQYQKISNYILNTPLAKKSRIDTDSSVDDEEIVLEISRFYMQRNDVKSILNTIPITIQNNILEQMISAITYYFKSLGFNRKYTGEKITYFLFENKLRRAINIPVNTDKILEIAV